MFNRLVSFFFPVCLALCAVPSFAEQIPVKADKPEPAPSMDITKSVEEMNSDKFAAPPTDFHAGHVTARELGADYLKAAGGGFSIQLPSRAPIPTPVVIKDKLFTSGGFHSKEFYCFNAHSGKLVWGVNLDDDGPSTAAYSDGVIVFNTESCTVFALEADTGKMLWSLYLGDPLTSSPTIDNGMVFTSYPAHGHPAAQAANNAPNAAPNAPKPAPNASHVLAALELKTGKILWQRWLDSDVMSAPVAVDGELYVTSFSGTIYRFKQKDGKIISATNSRATSAPVVVGDNVFVTNRTDTKPGEDAAEQVSGIDRGSGKGRFGAPAKKAEYLDAKVQAVTALKSAGDHLDAGNGFAAGAPMAANSLASVGNVGQDNVSTMQAFQGSRMAYLAGNTFNCMGDEVVCTEAGTGNIRWRFKLEGDLKKEGGFLGSPPATAGGRIFLATLKGEVLQSDPATGAIEKKYAVGSPVRSQPVIEGGRIYVGTQDGRIVCFDTGNANFTGWNHWGCNAARTGAQSEKK